MGNCTGCLLGLSTSYHTINAVVVLPKYVPKLLRYDVDTTGASISSWSWFKEPVGISKADAFVKAGLLEQISTTFDNSDYLWYSVSIDITSNEPFLQNESQVVLHVDSLGHGLHVFINGVHLGAKFGSSNNAKVSTDVPITLKPGKNAIDLLSLTVGLQVKFRNKNLLKARVCSVVFLSILLTETMLYS